MTAKTITRQNSEIRNHIGSCAGAFILSLLVCVALVLSQARAEGVSDRPGWRVYKTPFDFQTLSARVKAAVKSEKMDLVTRASASDGAKAQGHEIAGNEVLGIYRNDYARRMLAASVAAGIEAPIRLYLTEEDDQTATLSYKLPSFVFAPYMAEGGGELKLLAEELDLVFEDIVEKAVDLEWNP